MTVSVSGLVGHWVRCVGCRRVQRDRVGGRCDGCHSLLDPEYPPTELGRGPSWLDRFAAVLPVGPDYDRTLPAAPTPLRTWPEGAGRAGVGDLVLKDETVNPTYSTKYRMAVVAVEYARALDLDTFVFSSTGNSAAAFAHVLDHRADMTARYYWPRSSPLPAEVDASPQIEVIPVDAGGYTAAQRAARDDGVAPHEGGFFNLGRREGLKVAYLEAFEQLGHLPTVIVQAISSGMGLWAARRAADEFARRTGTTGRSPRLVGAQSAACAPMASAWADGSPTIRPCDVVDVPSGIARAILLGDPSASYPYVHQVVTGTGGAIIDVPDDRVCRAQRDVAAETGIDVCESSAVALAAASGLAGAGLAGPSDEVLALLSGGSRSAAAGSGRRPPS